tara:strand:+ start:622 stop:879 length:258 start_codon:yes stop_codon:yes gene_type:complete
MNGRLIQAALAVVNTAHRIATASAAVADAESRPWDYRAKHDLYVASGDLRIAQSGHREAVVRWAKLGESSTAADYLTEQGFELPE